MPKGFPSCHKLDLDHEHEVSARDMDFYIRSQVEHIEEMKLGGRLLDGEYPAIEQRLIDTLSRRAHEM